MKKYVSIVLLSLLVTAALPAYQIFKTAMKITVYDDLGNAVEGASVRLFENEEDYKKEKNQVEDTLYTDEKGEAYFKKLKPQPYFLLIEKGDMNNWNGATQTDTLKEKRVNKVRIIIE